MKLRKPLSLLLSAAMLTSMASFATSAVATNASEVSAGGYYNASYLESYAEKAYNETGLGCVYSKTSTTWKTWSPEATEVKLKLYKTGSDSESGAGVIGTYSLTKNSTTGVWSTTLSGDYKNVYYTYLVTVFGSTNETQDVYSKAAGVNGNRSMVVDLDSTDPKGWSNDKHVLFDSASEAVVWEAHVRDFSASKTSGVSEENQGKYLAFTEGGTTLNSDTSASAVSTGIDYLVEQGINCVQLMPIFDFQSVDESIPSSSTNRNWGYDPKNYNVPEGSYASDAYDGNTRITELKQMIQALHDRGISVVMDVVYNHTYATEGSCFSKTAPYYYYRQSTSDSYSNGSGCGNETASDKLMYRKYMIESLKYWAEEYHIDGFRFDLMAIHDVTTMNIIRNELDNLYSDGSGKKILMYGEPWAGGGVAISDGCTQSQANWLDARVGMFCDSYRDAIKGDSNGSGIGYIQGDTSKTYNVVTGVTGKSFNAKAPSQTIAYADAHDNLILWDKVVKSNGSSSWNSTSSSFKGQLKEAMTLVMTSQGIPFMTAGSEFCRTKQGDHNSYNASDSINAIDWARVKTYSDVAAYYKGLLEIRKNYTPMKDSSFNTPSFQSNYGYVVAYTYYNNKSDEWGKVCVLVNSGTQAYTINLDGSGWTVVADGTNAGLKSLGTVSGSSYSVPARSTAVLVESSTFSNLQNAETQYGKLTVKHVDDSGKVLKTTTAKYREGSTYRALPDNSILFDYSLKSTKGTTTGKVVGGKSYTVTFTYSSTGIASGYLTVKYVNSSGTEIKDKASYHLRAGDSYDIPVVAIQGYQLDTDKFPAGSSGTFGGSNKTIKFVYKDLDNTSSTVHYYNSNGWSDIRCYAYTSSGEQPNGDWNNATKMTSEGNGWFVCTIPAKSANIILHPSSGSGQEPGSGEDGYYVSGEVWIQNKTLTLSSKVITSHISASTGKKIADDVVNNQTKITSADTYTTSALSGRTDVITPSNAKGNYSAGVVNVVYLYTSSSTDTPSTTAGTIYFDNSSYNWSSVYAYVYTDDGTENAAWPGTKMTKDSSTGYYKLSVPASLSNGRVIFTESSDATTNRYPADWQSGLEINNKNMIFKANNEWSEYTAASKITLGSTSLSLAVGKYTYITEDSPNTVTWTSSNTSVATVSRYSSTKGKVTGVKAGTATITAKDTTGAKATCKVTVTSSGSITLGSTSLSLAVGKYAYITEDSSNTVTWTSSNTSVATVSRYSSTKGKVTGVKAGTATITATDTTGAKATCKVTVTSGSITLGATSLSLEAGKYAYITEDSSNTVTWTSSDTSVATVSRYSSTKGKVTAKKAGTATVTAKDTTGATATCKVTVTAGKITLGATSLSLEAGKYAYITEDSSSTVTWTSSDTSVATVSRYSSAKGKVTAKKAGTATITAKDANGATATCKVTVTSSKITLGATSLSLTAGKYAYITEDSSSSVTWTSSDTSVATVSRYSSTRGKVTAVKAGTATITAKDANGATATCKVTVTTPKLTLGTTSLSLEAGKYAYITEDSSSTVTWTSSDTTIATVSRYSSTKGKVTAKKAGTVTITAKDANGATAICKVTVTASKLTLGSTSLTLSVGETAYITENVSSTVTWTSSDTSIATVSRYSSAKGKVTAKKAGTVTITATTADGEKATCKVTVK